MKSIYSEVIGAVIILIGLIAVGAAFFSRMEFQVGLALAGAAFVFYGIARLERVLARRKDEENQRQILERLEKIEQQLEKQGQEQPKGGVAIADVLGAGLKYYTEHMAQPKEEEEKKDD